MKSIVIRKAIPDDLEILLKFEQGVIAAERPFDPTLRGDPVHYYDLEGMVTDPDVELVVAVDGQYVCASGYARITEAKHYLKHRRYAYLGFMFTDPAYRGQGINQLILESLQQWIASKGITEIRLEVYHGNASAIRAYEKAGFRKHMVEMRWEGES